MFMKKEWVAMLLAGGQGSRLYALPKSWPSPRCPFWQIPHHRFPLSNCVNSGIDTVGVLTQYQPLVLNEYLGNGQPWDLDRLNGGVFVLPPYQKSSGSTGTPAPPMPSARISPLLSVTTPNMFSSSPVITSTRWTTPRCWITTKDGRGLHHRGF